ncbi:uncharacterized protein LOC111316402 [Durio zibethinus]|uniref:Uncharacterized protein LOC111316402 n=1 Tax=Durio zibethinus TaxID=66656 RepID=A0A6P6BAH5_DURZI|nr:uncharacterized protein LOC111316402 [Durio zibethinus]
MRKIEEVTRYQVTFAKRRSSLIRKANEISVFCDVDVALVAFSPSGRWKLQKLKQLDYIKEDENKLLHLDNQDYEVENEEDASLAQILWCEKNLKNTLEEIKDRKRRLNEAYPSVGQIRVKVWIIEDSKQARPQGQIPFAYSFTGNQMLNRARQNLSSSSPFLMQHDPRTWPYRVHNGLLHPLHQPRGISVRVPGASSSFAFNPLADGFPATYHPGYSTFTHQIQIPPTYPPFQSRAFYWDQTAPSIQNLQLGVFRNSSMHQPIMGNPPIPFVPYQTLGALGTSNLYQPIMPGIVDQQLGMLGSSSVQQLMREDHITPGILNQQPGVLGDSFLDQSLMGNSMTPNVQLQAQQPRVLGSTSVQNSSNTQNDPSLPPMSQLQVDPNEVNLLCSHGYTTTQNLDVPPPLNTERVSSEPFFTNNIGSITTPTHRDGDNTNNGISGGNSNSNIDNSSTNYGNNTIGYCDTNEKHPAGSTQENPPPESPTDSIFLSSLLDEAAMANDTPKTAGNQEDGSMEWDGFTLAENLNLEDLDIIF